MRLIQAYLSYPNNKGIIMTASNWQQTDTLAASQLKLSVENLIGAYHQGKSGAAQAAIRFYEALWASGMSGEQLVEYRDLGLIAMIEADKKGLPEVQRAAANLYADIFASSSVESAELPKYMPLADIANQLDVVDTRLAGIQSLLAGDVAFVKQVATLPAAILSTAQQNMADNESGKSAASTLTTVYNLMQNPQTVSQLASQAIIAGAENLYHTYQADGANMDLPRRREVAAQYRNLSAFDRVVAEGTEQRQTTLNLGAMAAIPASRMSSTLGRVETALTPTGKALVETGATLENAFGFPRSADLAVASDVNLGLRDVGVDAEGRPVINRPAMYSLGSATDAMEITTVTKAAAVDKILDTHQALSALEEKLAERQAAIIAQGRSRAEIVIGQQSLVNGKYENLTPSQRITANNQALADDKTLQETLAKAHSLVQTVLIEQSELLMNALPGGAELVQLAEDEAALEAQLEARTSELAIQQKSPGPKALQLLQGKDAEYKRISNALESTTEQREIAQAALNRLADERLASTAGTPDTAAAMEALTKAVNADVVAGLRSSMSADQSKGVLKLLERELSASLSESVEASMER